MISFQSKQEDVNIESLNETSKKPLRVHRQSINTAQLLFSFSVYLPYLQHISKHSQIKILEKQNYVRQVLFIEKNNNTKLSDVMLKTRKIASDFLFFIFIKEYTLHELLYSYLLILH